MSKVMIKMGVHSVHEVWQPRKGQEYQFKHVKQGRHKLGEFHKYPDGSIVYWAERRSNETAYKEDAWVFDAATTMLIRFFGQADIGVLVDNGDRYRITFADFEKHRLKYQHPRFKTMFWKIGFEHWQFEKGTPEDMEKAMHIRKWG